MEEVVKRSKTCISFKKGSRRCKGWVAGRDRDRIASCEREEEAWGKGTFEVHVMLHLGESGEEGVQVGLAHGGRSNGRGKTRGLEQLFGKYWQGRADHQLVSLR